MAFVSSTIYYGTLGGRVLGAIGRRHCSDNARQNEDQSMGVVALSHTSPRRIFLASWTHFGRICDEWVDNDMCI